MVENLPIVFFMLQIIALLLFWSLIIRRHFQMASVYPLYVVRDKFINLVAEGKLEEDGLLFQEFYKAINIMIPNSKHLTFHNFVGAIIDARKKGYDPSLDEKLKEIQKALTLVRDNEVKDSIILFYDTVMSLLLRQSMSLRLMTWFVRISRQLKPISPPGVTPFQKKAWGILNDYQNAHSSIVCPA